MSASRAAAIRLTLFLAGCLGLFAYLLHLSGVGLPGSGGYEFEALVPDSLGVPPQADVRQAGVEVGNVTGVRAVGNVTALRLALDDEHAPIYRDARVLIRTKSVAGETYVELDPGRPTSGGIPSGGTLPLDRAQEATQLDAVLSALDRRRRSQLKRALAGLGGGLGRRGGDLNRLLEAASAAVERGEPVFRELAKQRGHVAGLVDDLGRMGRALGDRGRAIRSLARHTVIAAEAIESRNHELRRTLDRLPDFLRQVRETGTTLTGFAQEATPVVRELRLAVRDLVPAIRELEPAARSGRSAIRWLDRFSRAAGPAVAELGPFSTAARRTARPLGSALRHLNPLLAYLSPYWRELPSFLGMLGAGTKYTDPISHLGRVTPLLSMSALPGTVTAHQERVLEELADRADEDIDTRGVNAYPEPGEAGLTKPFGGRYERLRPDPPYDRGRR